jgi:hypothetical protein
MGLETLQQIRDDVESTMFADASIQDKYNEQIKQRLITQNSTEMLQNGGKVYVPSFSTDVTKTAGVQLNDHNFGNISDELIVAKNNQHAHQIVKQFTANDDAYSISSNGTPTFLTTIWTNKFFEVITRATVFEEISHSFQQGTFGLTNIKIPTVSLVGNYSLYADYSAQGNANINVNWIDRQVVNFEQTLVYGDLAIAQMSMGKIDYIGKMREALMRQIKLHQDALGFFGYSENMNIYGLLNDPSLAPTITAGQKAGAPTGSASTLWQYATFFEIIADIISLRQAVTSRAGGQDDDNDPCYLLIPTSIWQYLSTTSPLGNITVRDWIEKEYKSMKLMKAPLLDGTGTPIGSVTPNQLVLIFDNFAGQECLLNAYVSLYNSHGVVRHASSYQEKVSYTLGGAIVSNGIGIQIMSGV